MSFCFHPCSFRFQARLRRSSRQSADRRCSHTSYSTTSLLLSAEISNWAAQDNALYLEDYYQDLERLHLPKETLEILYRFVDDHPGIMLAELRDIAMGEGLSADLINIAIAKHD